MFGLVFLCNGWHRRVGRTGSGCSSSSSSGSRRRKRNKRKRSTAQPMSSPADQTDMLLAQDEPNTTFQQPPARLNSEIEDSIIVKEEERRENEQGKEISPAKSGNDGKEDNDNDGSASPIPLTQPILSDEDGETGENSKKDGVKSSSSSDLRNVQFKGQPVWQVDMEGLQLIRRMTDMRFYWNSIFQLIQKTNTIDPEELKNNVTSKLSPDVNGDYWLPSEEVVALADKYSLGKYLEPLLSIPSNTQRPVGDGAKNEEKDGIVKKQEQYDKESDNEGNKKKRTNSEPSVLESPSKKSKVTANDTVGDLNIPIYTYDLSEGNPNFPFTLKPLSTDNVINEHSKVIISSLFLPFQSKVTLAQVLESEAGFLNSSEGSNEKFKTSTLDDENTVEHGTNNDTVSDGVKTETEATNGEAGVNNDGTTDSTKANDDTLIDRNEINIDVPIDDNGQTALHLAATLGKVSLVQELIEKGANRFRGDNDGQTALIRVVHATNCFELACFDKLLDLLYPSIRLLDNRGRSILHHIALTCGLKGRYDASKYYLETLLEWVVKKGSKLPDDPSLTLTNFIKEVVNKSDKYGNTCLNYATLAGNKYIVSQLLDICADPHKANKIGVAPGDWGIDVNNSIVNTTVRDIGADQTSESSDNATRKHGTATSSAINGADANKVKTKGILSGLGSAEQDDKSSKGQSRLESNDFKESTNSLQILDSIQSFIANLGKDFKQEIMQKSQQIDKLNPILREKTLQLSRKRKQYDELQKMVRKISKITNKIDNLNKAIAEEESAFQQEIQNSCINIDQNNCLGDFDADQPFTILPLYQEVEQIVEKVLEEKLKRIGQEQGKTADDNESGNNDKTDSAAGGDAADSTGLSSHAVLRALTSIKAEDILPYYEQQLPPDKKELLRKSIPPSVVLDARIRAYQKNNQVLMDRMNKKRNSNKELESQFKRIIGLCIGTDTDNIDDRLLSSLLMSVETDPDPEIGQIKKVLKIVGDLDGDDGSPASHTAPASSTAS